MVHELGVEVWLGARLRGCGWQPKSDCALASQQATPSARAHVRGFGDQRSRRLDQPAVVLSKAGSKSLIPRACSPTSGEVATSFQHLTADHLVEGRLRLTL